MTRRATHFALADDLIIVRAHVTGPSGTRAGAFVLDTGAALTTITHELAEIIGYSPRDGFRRAKVRTAVGEEHGYLLLLAAFSALGFEEAAFPVHVFDLGHADIDGLIGMNYLAAFNLEIRPAEQLLLVESVS